MSHYFDVGFSVREPAWHGLATVLEDYPGRAEAMRYAGHDFTISERELYYTISAENPDVTPVASHKALIRDDNRELVGIVGKGYKVVQNDQLWDVVDALASQENVRYETAGVLKGGAVLWVLARLDEPIEIPGDDSATYPYVLASTTHDGSGACQVASTAVRVICWNTYSAAKGHGRWYTFRHTKNVADQLESAKAAIAGVRQEAEDFQELATELTRLQVGEEGIRNFLNRFIPEPDAAVVTDRVRKNIRTAREQVRECLHSRTVPAQLQGTAYGLFQAGLEYLDHKRKSKSRESYFRRNMMTQDKLKNSLVELARDCAA